jgi:serine/threonine-protein kinase RsbW
MTTMPDLVCAFIRFTIFPRSGIKLGLIDYVRRCWSGNPDQPNWEAKPLKPETPDQHRPTFNGAFFHPTGKVAARPQSWEVAMLASHAEASLAGRLDPPEAWNCHRLSSFAEMGAVIDIVLAAMTDHGFSHKDMFGTRLVLEEAVCNSIKHGHRHDPAKFVEVRYAIRSDHVLFEVEDEGPGFDPAHIPDARATENLERTGGRGLLLIQHYSAWVRYNRQGNCVAFCICASDPGIP